MLGEAPTAPTAFGKVSMQHSKQSFMALAKDTSVKNVLKPL